MKVLFDVFIEMASILFMGIVCLIIYIFGKIFLIKIGFIEEIQTDESDEENKIKK